MALHIIVVIALGMSKLKPIGKVFTGRDHSWVNLGCEEGFRVPMPFISECRSGLTEGMGAASTPAEERHMHSSSIQN